MQRYSAPFRRVVGLQTALHRVAAGIASLGVHQCDVLRIIASDICIDIERPERLPIIDFSAGTPIAVDIDRSGGARACLCVVNDVFCNAVQFVLSFGRCRKS